MRLQRPHSNDIAPAEHILLYTPPTPLHHVDFDLASLFWWSGAILLQYDWTRRREWLSFFRLEGVRNCRVTIQSAG